jgi:hypothetical protein
MSLLQDMRYPAVAARLFGRHVNESTLKPELGLLT